MARTNNLTNFLNDVATAIKTKLGDSTAIPAAQFDSKIMDIHTGGTYQTKSITIQTNGNYTLNPDSGYDAMDQVTISVTVPQTGGDVKLFTTEQAMQADLNPSEGDLAVVYREEIQPVQEDSEFSSCIFPNTVVLDEAFTGSVYGRFRQVDHGYFDGMIHVSSTAFIFQGYGESSEIIVQYTSSDGITYTRTDGGEELVEFGATIKWENWGDPFNAIIGDFMKTGGFYYDGLYKYGPYTDVNKFKPVMRESIILDGLTATWNGTYKNELIEKSMLISIANTIKEDIGSGWTKTIYTCLKDNKWNIFFPQAQYEGVNDMYIYCITCMNNNSVLTPVGIGSNQSSSTSGNTKTKPPRRFEVDLVNQTYVDKGVVSVTEYHGTSYYFSYADLLPDSIMYALNLSDGTVTKSQNVIVYLDTTSHFISSPSYETNYTYDKYLIAPTQLTLKNTNELLQNITAYGKNGVVTGDGSIYNNLDNGYILQNIYNLPQINPTLYGYNIKSTAVPNNINIPKAKGCYIKPGTYTNNALFDISNVIKTGSTNYLSNSGNYYVNNRIVYDSHTHESVRDLGQIYMLGYYNGCVLYTKEQVQPTVSSVIYKYDIDNNTEVSTGSTAAISSSYNWTYKYTHFLVLGNILICDANGENNSPKLIAASLKVCNLDTGVEYVIYNHQNTISSGSNLGYAVTPILVNDNKLVIFERFKNSSGSYIYYMYDYTISTNTLLVKANATTTQLIKSSTNYMYKDGYCIVDNYAIVVQDSYAYALNISQPTAMISISSDSVLKTCISNYKDGSVPYTYDSVTTRWRCVTNITYNGATNLSFTFGDYLPFGNNCPLYTLAGTSIGLISSADALTYTFDSVNNKYIATSKKGNIIGINMNVEPYILTTTNDASRYIIDGNADSSSSYKLLSVFDII